METKDKKKLTRKDIDKLVKNKTKKLNEKEDILK
jgi:hypothetical protein